MSADRPTPPPETEAEIMRAVSTVLYEDGYAGLSMRRVAAESPKSKSLLQHYYGTKHDLVLAFLSYLIGRYLDGVESIDADDPRVRLESFLRWALGLDADDDFWWLHASLLELQVQARHDPDIRARFVDNFATVHGTVAEMIRDADSSPGGIDDADDAATLVTTFVYAARMRRLTHDDPDAMDGARRVLDALLPSIDLGESARD